ncbi:MAG TPA: DUF4402 domain-containing protein [Sphingomicrobium sp.]|nr:DUF4402 domain-containing protein [Sphingomicrobium sp.]
MGLRLGTIAALAAAAAACFGAPADAATINAEAKAKVVKPVAIESVQDLDLGTILLGPGIWSGAIVKLSRSGALTCPTAVTCSGATQVAIYNIVGSNGQTVVISVPNVTLTNQSDPAKTLTLVPDAQPTVQLTNSGNPGTDLPIGGSITIDSTTADGIYTGTFNVTADYQ